MSNPLPEPARVAPVLGVIRNVYTADQLRAHAAAEVAAARDCHTCRHFAVCLSPHHKGKDCTNADRYEALPVVRLWRKK